MIIVLMLPNLTRIGILIDFKINQDFIAEVLCINREKPITICGGSCYLAKQLKKAEEQEEKQAPNSKKQRVEVVYCHTQSTFDLPKINECNAGELNPACIEEFYLSSFVADIFRPPKSHLI